MKMKQIIIIIALLISSITISAENRISITACIDAALKNKANIQAVRTDIELADLRTDAAWAQYLPQILISYNYRYNAIIPSQIVPVGQFSPVPTDETRAIRFGTDWQQNAGVSLYQPVIDFSIRSRVSESKINERIKHADLKIAEQELITEVINSFITVWLKEEQLQSAGLDTLRAFRSLSMVMAKSDEGRVHKSDLNRAVLNYNNALSAYNAVLSELVKEKIYLGFLTGLSLDLMLGGEYDFSVLNDSSLFKIAGNPVYDSIPGLHQLQFSKDLLVQQERTELWNYTPVIGIEGFLGANQYTTDFDPFLGNRWYGNSYIGLSLRLPLISGENVRNMVQQLRLQEKTIEYRIAEEQDRINHTDLRLAEDIKRLEFQISMSSENIHLLEENLNLYHERFTEGQINAYDMISQEIDLQKEKALFNQHRAELYRKQVERIRNSGRFNMWVRNLN